MIGVDGDSCGGGGRCGWLWHWLVVVVIDGDNNSG